MIYFRQLTTMMLLVALVAMVTIQVSCDDDNSKDKPNHKPQKMKIGQIAFPEIAGPKLDGHDINDFLSFEDFMKTYHPDYKYKQNFFEKVAGKIKNNGH